MNNGIPLLTVGDAAGMLLGAGLIQVNSNLKVSLILIGAGVILKVLIAVLQKFNIPVSTSAH